MVSVIMAAYNAEKYISEAIFSVINQSYSNWELIIINDGSKDRTEEIILSFEDTRIKYFKQENKGVSVARNVGLKNRKGTYFCFLDSDDCFTPNSLESRVKVFESDSNVEFVDGTIQCMDVHLEKILRIRRFSYYGNPFNSLVRLEEKCFFGPSWMVKNNPKKEYILDKNMTHAEDLMFYISISTDGIYSATNDVILNYRISDISAMSNLKGLERGYIKLFNNIVNHYEVPSKDIIYLRFRITRIMFLSYLSHKDFFNAFSAIRLLFFMR
jgi:glycosyltransferase involved in cell wall biosynthesis